MTNTVELTTVLEGNGADHPPFDPNTLAETAAEALGCMIARLTGVTGPSLFIIDTDAKAVSPRTRFTWVTTWEEAAAPAEAPKVKPIPVKWPEQRLARGAKWHGTVPDKDGKPVDAYLISNGTALVLLDSAEGRAIEASLAEGV